jgi:hypothetical protein
MRKRWIETCNLQSKRNGGSEMARKKYYVNLNEEERQMLKDQTGKGTLKARQFKRAMILLKADQ